MGLICVLLTMLLAMRTIPICCLPAQVYELKYAQLREADMQR